MVVWLSSSRRTASLTQEFQFGDGDKQSVAEYLASQSKDLKIVAYKRFTLAAE